MGKVHTIDRDVDPRNSRVRYHISDEGNVVDDLRPSRAFTISPNGEIFTNSVPIDREQTPLLTFSVVAIDGGDPPLSAYATVTVRIEDINDNAPQWIYPPSGPRAASVNISVYSTVGMVIARLEAVDPDVGLNAQIEYELIRGNSQGYFELDRLSGTLYLAKMLEVSQETTNRSTPAAATIEQLPPTSFALSLKATDNGDPPRSNTSILRIFVHTVESARIPGPPDDTSQRLKQNANPYGSSSGNSYYHRQHGSFVDKDFLVMVVMIIITLLVSALLITAIVLLRCRQIHASREADSHHQAGGGGGSRAVGGAELVSVAQVKPPHLWVPPPSRDSSAKSGYTMDSSKSGNATLDGQTHYMTPMSELN